MGPPRAGPAAAADDIIGSRPGCRFLKPELGNKRSSPGPAPAANRRGPALPSQVGPARVGGWHGEPGHHLCRRAGQGLRAHREAIRLSESSAGLGGNRRHEFPCHGGEKGPQSGSERDGQADYGRSPDRWGFFKVTFFAKGFNCLKMQGGFVLKNCGEGYIQL